MRRTLVTRALTRGSPRVRAGPEVESCEFVIDRSGGTREGEERDRIGLYDEGSKMKRKISKRKNQEMQNLLRIDMDLY